MQNVIVRLGMMLVVLTTLALAGWPTSVSAAAPPRQATGAIAGIVTDAHGHAVAGATVTLENDHHHVIASTITDHQGRFYFFHVRPGHYIVRAVKDHVGHGSAGVDVHTGMTSHVHVVLR